MEQDPDLRVSLHASAASPHLAMGDAHLAQLGPNWVEGGARALQMWQGLRKRKT